MYGRLFFLDKQPGVHTVGVGKDWTRLLPKCVQRVVGPKATNVC